MSAAMRRVLMALLGVATALAVGACGSSGSGASSSSTSPGASASSGAAKPDATKGATNGAKGSTGTTQQVPQRVTETLAHIDAGDWPDAAHAPGTHGGDPFGNREKRLPTTDSSGKKISYTEWDVNAKKRGQGRDAERIITGSDGSAWFTLDHYSHFTRIR